jgi:hypothetical protein
VLASEKGPPLWAHVVAGVAGVGLAAWGTAEVVAGGSCDGELQARKACSSQLEQRDRGAVVLLAALPLLALPLTRLVRRATRSEAQLARWKLEPELVARPRSVVMNIRMPWL